MNGIFMVVGVPPLICKYHFRNCAKQCLSLSFGPYCQRKQRLRADRVSLTHTTEKRSGSLPCPLACCCCEGSRVNPKPHRSHVRQGVCGGGAEWQTRSRPGALGTARRRGVKKPRQGQCGAGEEAAQTSPAVPNQTTTHENSLLKHT
eukprot:g64385.t1